MNDHDDGRGLQPRRLGAMGLLVFALLGLGSAACSADSGGERSRNAAASASASADPQDTSSPSSASPAITQSPDSSAAASNESPASGPSAPVEPTVAAAGAPGPVSQESVLGSLPGGTDGSCVEVDGQRDVRSGSMAAGNFAEAITAFTQQSTGGGATVRLYWIPQHGDQLPGVTVRGTRLEDGQEFTHGDSTFGEAEQWRYYLTEITIPSPGTWRLEATSGPDRGCFTVTFAD